MPRRKQVKVNRDMTVLQLSEILGVEVPVVIKELFGYGILRTVSMIVQVDIARRVAISLGYEIIGDDEDDNGETLDDLPKNDPPPKDPPDSHRFSHKPRRRPHRP